MDKLERAVVQLLSKWCPLKIEVDPFHRRNNMVLTHGHWVWFGGAGTPRRRAAKASYHLWLLSTGDPWQAGQVKTCHVFGQRRGMVFNENDGFTVTWQSVHESHRQSKSSNFGLEMPRILRGNGNHDLS